MSQTSALQSGREAINPEIIRPMITWFLIVWLRPTGHGNWPHILITPHPVNTQTVTTPQLFTPTPGKHCPLYELPAGKGRFAP
jgi:hypothetical protein